MDGWMVCVCVCVRVYVCVCDTSDPIYSAWHSNMQHTSKVKSCDFPRSIALTSGNSRVSCHSNIKPRH